MGCTYVVNKKGVMYEIGIALPYYATDERLSAMHANARFFAVAYDLLKEEAS